MQSRITQPFLAVLLVALLGSVAWLNARVAPSTPPSLPSPDALKRYGFALQEVARRSGIDFTHHAPTLDPALAPIMPQVASMGASVTVADFDHDGWPDIYVTDSGEGSQNRLYHNNHDGTFTDVAAKMGVADLNQPGTGVSMGAVWGDYDNDGYPDLLVYKWGKPELFHNDGGKAFTRVTDQAQLPAWVNANSATWVDYDNDGRLDLLICGYYPDDVDLWHLKNTRMMPDSFEYANNGGRKYLLHNLGGGKFEDVTKEMGLGADHRWTLAVGAADLRGTGYPDLVFANDYGVTEFYANQQGRGFQEIGQASNIGYRPKSGMNVAFGDIQNAGRFAIYVTNISAPGNLVQGNNLWMPSGPPSRAPHYDNIATTAGVELGGWSFGAQFGDLNNDGTLDLFLTNGYISASRDKDYWYNYGLIAVGNGNIIADAKSWPSMQDPKTGETMSLSGYERKHVWLNDGYGTFKDVAGAVGVTDTHDGRAVAEADLWNTGALDVLVATQRGPLLLYKNTVAPGRHWVEFALAGTKANRDAVGAQVRLYWKDAEGREVSQLQQVSAASGFCAQNDHRLHFGLGKNPKIEKALIRWPDGSPTQTVGSPQIGIDKLHAIQEP